MRPPSRDRKPATPVTIIGAGLSGLTLARVLHLHGVPVTIYDKQPSADAAAQPGQTHVHTQGQDALEAADLFDQFLYLIRKGGEAVRVLDHHATVLYTVPEDDSGNHPLVLREELRRLLLDSLPPDTVLWGKRLTAVNALGAGHHKLTFADGLTVSTELLVGADGAWSITRHLRTDATPEYTGTMILETRLFDVDEKHPEAAATVGDGAMLAFAPGRGIIAHREPNDTLRVRIHLRRPAGWAAHERLTSSRVAAELDGWAPSLLDLITAGELAPFVHMVHTLPTGHRWSRVPGVTLVGDAAHLAPPTPWSASWAMFDGAELGNAIAGTSTCEAALTAYEEALFSRLDAISAHANLMLAVSLDERAPLGLIDLLILTGDR